MDSFIKSVISGAQALWHLFVAIFMILIGGCLSQAQVDCIAISLYVSAGLLLLVVSIYKGIKNGSLGA